MMIQLSQLTTGQIQQLKNTVNSIVTANISYDQIHKLVIQDPSADTESTSTITQEILLNEIYTKFEVLNHLTRITLSVLENAQTLLEQKQIFRQRSQQLLQGLHFIELDYYELREENQKLKDNISQQRYTNQILKSEKDQYQIKYKQTSLQCSKLTEYYQQQIAQLSAQLKIKVESPQVLINTILTKKYDSVQQEIIQLRAQVYELKRTCKQYQTQNILMAKNLELFNHKIAELQNEKNIYKQIQYNIGNTKFYHNQSFSSESKDNTSSNQNAVKNLHKDLLTINDCFIHDSYAKQSKIIHTLEQEQSFTSRSRSKLQVNMPELWSNFENQHLNLNASEDEKPSQIKQNIPDLQCNKQCSQQFKESISALMQQQRLFNSIAKKQEIKTLQSLPDRANEQSATQQAQQSGLVGPQQINTDIKKQQIRQSRMKLLSRYGKKEEDDLSVLKCENNAHLYRKYRGQLQRKYPSLKKFANKVLDRKMQIISEGIVRKDKVSQIVLKNRDRPHADKNSIESAQPYKQMEECRSRKPKPKSIQLKHKQQQGRRKQQQGRHK